MAIQYSGNAMTSTFVPTTKQDIIDNVETALLAAGWATVSGHATTSLLMQSATTPQGFAIRVRLQDNGGNCVQFSLESTDGVVIGNNATDHAGGHLYPNAGSWTYRVVCCKYQAFIFATPYTGQMRSYVGFGVPCLPDFLVETTTRVGWMQSNGKRDDNTDGCYSFRTRLNRDNDCGAQETITGGVVWDMSGNSTPGGVCLAELLAPHQDNINNGRFWADQTALISDAIVCWSDFTTSNAGLFRGYLWDACVVSGLYASDLTLSSDGHNWIVLTEGSSPSWASSATLILATS